MYRKIDLTAINVRLGYCRCSSYAKLSVLEDFEKFAENYRTEKPKQSSRSMGTLCPLKLQNPGRFENQRTL